MDRRALALSLLFATACRAIVGIQELTVEDGGSDGGHDGTAEGATGPDGTVDAADAPSHDASDAPVVDQTVSDALAGDGEGATDSSAGDAPDATGTADAADAMDAMDAMDATSAADVADAAPGADASDAGAVAPSCAPGGPGMTNCGTGSESCCTSLKVTGGTYARTYSNSDGGPTGTADPATISDFRLDKYEVTVGRFRQFRAAYNAGTWTSSVTAGSGKHTHLCGGQGLVNGGATACQVGATYEPGWVATDDGSVGPTDGNLACDPNFATWTPSKGNNENKPIGCANWWESYAFCIWDGGFLPSEAEWEYAAAGGIQELEYPWGSTPPGTACPGTGCSLAIYGCYYPSGSGSCSDASNIAPVGTPTAGAGAWGQLDLAGNVWEWNLDWFSPSYVAPCPDCAYLTGPSARVFRGADFTNDATHLLPPNRAHNGGGVGADPSFRGHAVGLRCARAP